MTACGRELPITTPLDDRPLLSTKQPFNKGEFQQPERPQAAICSYSTLSENDVPVLCQNVESRYLQAKSKQLDATNEEITFEDHHTMLQLVIHALYFALVFVY
jgi:hypothetical protein